MRHLAASPFDVACQPGMGPLSRCASSLILAAKRQDAASTIITCGRSPHRRMGGMKHQTSAHRQHAYRDDGSRIAALLVVLTLSWFSDPAFAIDPDRALTQAFLRKWQFPQSLPQATISAI